MSSVQKTEDEMEEKAEEIAFDDLLNELEALEMAYEERIPEEIEEQPEYDDEPAKEVEEQAEQVDEEQIQAAIKVQALHRGAKERQEFRKKARVNRQTTVNPERTHAQKRSKRNESSCSKTSSYLSRK